MLTDPEVQKTDPEVQKIVAACCGVFRTFGRGSSTEFSGNNPIPDALKDRAPMFTAGVDVEAVVRFVLILSKQC